MRYLLFLICLLFTANIYAQTSDNSKRRKEEIMPKADYDVNEYLGHQMHYPDTARKYNIEGRVLVKFVVNEDGTISDCTVEKGIGGGCDEEALRVIKSLPPWNPGIQDGKAVKVYFTIGLVFKLED
jgi:periplasmic protein TonB